MYTLSPSSKNHKHELRSATCADPDFFPGDLRDECVSQGEGGSKAYFFKDNFAIGI